MEKKVKDFFSARNIAYLAVLSALVIVMKLWGIAIKICLTEFKFRTDTYNSRSNYFRSVCGVDTGIYFRIRRLDDGCNGN